MDTHYVTISPTGEVVIDMSVLERAHEHAKATSDLLEQLRGQGCKRVKLSVAETRQVISKHHLAMFLNSNSQNPPTEDDQRHLDELTESLIEKLFK